MKYFAITVVAALGCFFAASPALAEPAAPAVVCTVEVAVSILEGEVTDFSSQGGKCPPGNVCPRRRHHGRSLYSIKLNLNI